MSLTDWTDAGRDTLRNIGDYATGFMEPTVRLGITGLSRAGKTVFLTALVQNLIAGGRLPFFDAVARGRVTAAHLEPQPDDTVPRFAYERHLEALSGEPPSWPQSTRAVSQLRITLDYTTDSLIWRQFGTQRMHIDLVDYPGEWLLDLPLLGLTYEEWSRDTLTSFAAPSRDDLVKPFADFLASHSATSAQDETIAQNGASLFTKTLEKLRDNDIGVTIIGPGRFLMPGELEGSPALTFFPLPLSDIKQDAAPETLHAMMRRRFNSYKSQVVKPFYQNHFSRLDRQIVLVDALTALNAGPSAIGELERTLTHILKSFRPGSNSWLSSILTKKIDRIVFAATKADHIHHTSHDQLEAILARIIKTASDRASFEGAEIETVALTAVRATREGEVETKGQLLPCIIGTPMAGETVGTTTFDGSKEAAIFPGDLPDDPENLFPAQITDGDPASIAPVAFTRFRPPKYTVDASGLLRPAPHIRLDRAVNFLIGDRIS